MTTEAITSAYPNHPDRRSDLVGMVDLIRQNASLQQQAEQQAAIGQYFTPATTARTMASMFAFSQSDIRLLDAGAGIGSLFAACVDVLCNREQPPKRIQVTAFEIDKAIIPYLQQTMELCRQYCVQSGVVFEGTIIQDDFLKCAAEFVSGSVFQTNQLPSFHAAILNPPYKKININSSARRYIRDLGLETSNMYSGFLAAVIRLLAPNGEMVAITPRSFCNGLYFKPFRKFLLTNMALRKIHLYESRDQAFRNDDVLQETIIFHAEKSPKTQGNISTTIAQGPEDRNPDVRVVPFLHVVKHHDPELYIHVISNASAGSVADTMSRLTATLHDLDIQVSTGRVVDFRAAQYLHHRPEPHSVPLIYPSHIEGSSVIWPRDGKKKPNAISQLKETADLLVPNDCYVLVKRFSSKEERRRIVAALFERQHFSYEAIGFENHLNYFHCHGHGLSPDLARGLVAFLNSTLVDTYFRLFSGHTQVNATDLRNMHYPSSEQLFRLGIALPNPFPEQQELDSLIERIVF